MLIGFLGDLHGRVFQALAVLTRWQLETGQKLDLIIQVGDLGVFPDLARLDEATRRFVERDPSEVDFNRLLTAEGGLAIALNYVRAQLRSPIYFIRGNHEDMDWLSQYATISAVDPFDLFHYVPDGTHHQFGETTIAFLGGVQTAMPEPESIDQAAYDRLAQLGGGVVDILVTHQGPYGVGLGYHGNVLGSTEITDLIVRLQPRYHIAGHFHSGWGPNRYGQTTSIGLKILVPIYDNPDLLVQPGCMALLDTTSNRLDIVTDNWMSEYSTKDFNLAEYVAQIGG